VRPVALIAGNFVREQRWPILVLLTWILVLAGVQAIVDVSRSKDDLLFLFQQVATYVLVFVVFFGISAIRNERKSRRILMVLSKGISRRQYVAGQLAGILLASTIFCGGLVFAGLAILRGFGYAASQVLWLMLALLVACLLTGAVTLLFSAFLHPLVAAGATFTLLGVPVLLVRTSGAGWRYLLPVYPLLQSFYRLSAPDLNLPEAGLLAGGVLEAVIVWLAASWVFSRKDISVAIE
jgi:ABC-type transport system involved in multi-copper enzyme maturation permease subunit